MDENQIAIFAKQAIERFGAGRAALSVAEFCAAFDVGRSTYYKMAAEKRAPKSFKCGARRLISVEAIRCWVKQLEEQSDV